VIVGDEDGGVAQAIRGLTAAVQRFGIEPSFISLRDGAFCQILRASGFSVHVLNVEPIPVLRGGLLAKLQQQLHIRRAATRIRPRLAEMLRSLTAQAVQVLWPNLMPPAAMAARDIGIACFWEVPGVLGRYPFSVNRRLIQHTMHRWNVIPLANSQYTAESLGNAPVKPTLLYLGADEARFNPAIIDSVKRDTINIPLDATVLGICARLKRSKGQRQVLEAMAKLPEEYSNAHLLLLGGPADGEFAGELRSLATQLGIASRLHLLGNVPDPERYYGAIDIAINAYLGAESFGLSVVEAMMMGKPVLVHALGGPAETVIDGVTGWHVHEPTVEGFRQGLLRAFGDREKWPGMGAAARERALEHFTLSRQAQQYVKIVRQRLG
jgi:glycosyltransferase involved in cell wall biosynthesis